MEEELVGDAPRSRKRAIRGAQLASLRLRGEAVRQLSCRFGWKPFDGRQWRTGEGEKLLLLS